MSAWHEQPVLFECEGDRLVGIATLPNEPIQYGVLIVVGGPQYRSGSHRQFTLLARQLADHGIASLRFDYRGMGDSEGAMRNFESIDADIRAAIDTLMTTVPALKGVAIWGLCDAASAAMIYAHTDPRVSGLVLLNPWVHSQAAEAQARLQRYYPSRLFNYDFWLKLAKFEVNVSTACLELSRFLLQRKARPDKHGAQKDFTERMLDGITQFKGESLIILSDLEDLTAQIFNSLMVNAPKWRELYQGPCATCMTLNGANHTFSSDIWRNQVGSWTITWITDHLATPDQCRTCDHQDHA